MFQHGISNGYGTDTLIAPASGTLPSLAEQTLTGLSPHTTYHYRATATNSTGAIVGTDVSFTTAWDWQSWAAGNLTWTDGASYSLAANTPDTAVSTEISRIVDGPETEWVTVAIDASVRARFVRLKAVMP